MKRMRKISKGRAVEVVMKLNVLRWIGCGLGLALAMTILLGHIRHAEQFPLKHVKADFSETTAITTK